MSAKKCTTLIPRRNEGGIRNGRRWRRNRRSWKNIRRRKRRRIKRETYKQEENI
jgi:hypothetical protein